MRPTILEALSDLYGPAAAHDVAGRLQNMLDEYRPRLPFPHPRSFSERDAILITYGDMVRAPSAPPLAVLADILRRHVAGLVSAIHLLPFFPYSSDDGFSVIDYHTVDPALGDWSDIAALGAQFQLMIDAVVNHVSTQHNWFRRFCDNAPRYRDYFIVVDPATDLSRVFRPRARPLLNPAQTAAGRKHVWTTFSADQIDLNYRNPDVLLAVLEVLLFYVSQGASFLRLDAIAYLWKEPGTSSIHRPQTHRIVQLMRAVLDEVAPQVILITETNVPHPDNIAYFGDGANEAQMVYNFSLPPLVLHAFHTGDAAALARWAAALTTPSEKVTFFNFLASHDGIGVTPARGILSDAAIEALAERTLALGGRVSYKSNPDGTQSAYELNINYLDALGDPAHADEPLEIIARRFLCAQAIMLALRGVPGIYFHSLFGSRGWPTGVARTGRPRTINRQKLQRAPLEAELADPHSLRKRIFSQFAHMLRVRRACPAFHPSGAQRVLVVEPAVFAVLRSDPAGETHVLCLHNVSAVPRRLALPETELPFSRNAGLADLLGNSGALYGAELTLAAYQRLWLVEAKN
ncbi:MAG: sugar phosphorylase [Anaerolineales bacterium]